MSVLPPLPFPLQPAHELAAASPSCARNQSAWPPPANAAPSALIAHPLRALGLQRLTPRGERRVRALYASLIVRAARLLELPALTGATAALYFSRFYAQNSLLAHAPGLCAAAALFLASKVEENTRRVRDVINVVYRCEHSPPHPPPPPQPQPSHAATPLHPYAYSSPLHPSSTSPTLAAMNAPGSGTQQPPPLLQAAASEAPDSRLEVSPLFWELKEEVLRFEQKLLRVLGYAMRVTHPHTYVLHFARELECSEELCRLAYYIANDSVRTTLALQYAPHAIACAAIYLASELAQEQIRYHPTVILGAGETRLSSAAAASPYRSPHHSQTAPVAPAASSSTSASALVLSSSAHGSEWWEHFGGVNQLEVEDITHQLLDLFEMQGDEDSAGYGHGHGARTLLQELERVAEEVQNELRREAAVEAARSQRIEASVRAGAAAAVSASAAHAAHAAPSDVHMADAHSASHAPPPHAERTSHNMDGRPSYTDSAAGATDAAYAPSAAAAAASAAAAGKLPQRLQLQSYPSAGRSLMQATAAPSASFGDDAAASSAPSYAAAYAPAGGGSGFPSYGGAPSGLPSMPSTSIASAQPGSSTFSYAPSYGPPFSAAPPATGTTLHASTGVQQNSLLPPAAPGRMYSL